MEAKIDKKTHPMGIKVERLAIPKCPKIDGVDPITFSRDNLSGKRWLAIRLVSGSYPTRPDLQVADCYEAVPN